jgi:hypothetical protein
MNKINKRISFISKKFIDLINEKKKFKPELIDVLQFKDKKEAIIFSKDKYIAAYDYAKNKGLLDSSYYPEISVGFAKILLSKFLKFKYSRN